MLFSGLNTFAPFHSFAFCFSFQPDVHFRFVNMAWNIWSQLIYFTQYFESKWLCPFRLPLKRLSNLFTVLLFVPFWNISWKNVLAWLRIGSINDKSENWYFVSFRSSTIFALFWFFEFSIFQIFLYANKQHYSNLNTFVSFLISINTPTLTGVLSTW